MILPKLTKQARSPFQRLLVVFTIQLILLTIIFTISGCGRISQPKPDIAWQDLVLQLNDIERMARLDTPDSQLISTSDPTRQNIDRNRCIRKEPDGWMVIADLKGPGYVSRFWYTGSNSDQHKIRFYFDNEKKPRFETTLVEFFGGRAPFLPPLAQHEQACYYSYLPISYNKRLIIMIGDTDLANGLPLMDYHHVNYSSLPTNISVQTLPTKFTSDDLEAVEKVRTAWLCSDSIKQNEADETEVSSVITLQPSCRHHMKSITGPGIITELQIAPDFASIDSPSIRENTLRNVVLEVFWNNKNEPSINVPLGDFFGSLERRTRFSSLCVGMKDATFFSRLPMPFMTSATVGFRNDGPVPVTLSVKTSIKKLAEWNDQLGYLHAAWQKSGPSDLGRPHTILKTAGRGKFVGCQLGITGEKNGWWILESNEYMYRDNEQIPSWQGTGLEDYFNGGWYYVNPLVRPLSGLTFMAPYTTVQYRFHINDAPQFQKSMYIELERGPNNGTPGWIESTAYYYLSEPVTACSNLMTTKERLSPKRPLMEFTLMRELINQERLGDFQGANDHIDEFLDQMPNYPQKEMLRLRQLSYRKRTEGFTDVIKKELEQFAENSSDKNVSNEAKKIIWFHESNNRALLTLYCNADTTAFIDGKQLCRVDNPEMMFAIPIILSPGEHTLCLTSTAKRHMPWVQASLITHEGIFASNPDWKYTTKPTGNFHSPSFDDSSWEDSNPSMKGPPEAPYLKLYPNPHVEVQCMAKPMVIPNWQKPGNASVVFRKKIILTGKTNNDNK